jgi:hypothetical protein
MEGAIPGLAAVLMELIKRLIVHEDEGDGIGEAVAAEAEEVIIAGIDPRFTRRREPEQQAAKHRQRRAHSGPDQCRLPDGFALHPLRRQFRKSGGGRQLFSADHSSNRVQMSLRSSPAKCLVMRDAAGFKMLQQYAWFRSPEKIFTSLFPWLADVKWNDCDSFKKSWAGINYNFWKYYEQKSETEFWMFDGELVLCWFGFECGLGGQPNGAFHSQSGHGRGMRWRLYWVCKNDECGRLYLDHTTNQCNYWHLH